MAYYDIMCFLEYYADRLNILDPDTGKRAPTAQWQNFYQAPQQFGIDSDVTGDFFYLPFDVDGFGSSEAGSINDLTVTLAAIGDVVDFTDAAMQDDTLVIASLIVQDPGQDSFDVSSAQIVNRYVGSIDSAGLSDTTVVWQVNPTINKTKAQIPTRKISSDLLGRFIGV